jgi:hypothetical protein
MPLKSTCGAGNCHSDDGPPTIARAKAITDRVFDPQRNKHAIAQTALRQRAVRRDRQRAIGIEKFFPGK